jgi:hypothetical protein
MVQRGIVLDADEVALEVRVSNKRAQKLYEKYEFRTVDVKKRYYRNNNEDAYDMRLNVQVESICDSFKKRYDALFKRHQLIDDFSLYDPPHAQKSP